MKKHNPSNGQNDKLVHWWLLVHFSHFGGLQNKRLINYYFTFFKKKNLISFSFPFPLVFSHFLSFHYFFFFSFHVSFLFVGFFFYTTTSSQNNSLLLLMLLLFCDDTHWCVFLCLGVSRNHHHPFFAITTPSPSFNDPPCKSHS